MIEIVQGDLFDTITHDGTHAIVNAVNCQGVMGAGLAKVFAQRYPGMEQAYIEACKDGRCAPGRCHVWPEQGFYIVNFPSKPDYSVPSTLGGIRDSMIDLVRVVKILQLRSVAVPALGAGLGGLDWPSVRKAIEEEIHDWDPEVQSRRWLLFEPL